jgi:hypothetical protein
MKRYSIMVVESGSDHEIELCQVDNNPRAIADAASAKRIAGRHRLSKYSSVRVQENFAARSA